MIELKNKGPKKSKIKKFPEWVIYGNAASLKLWEEAWHQAFLDYIKSQNFGQDKK